MAAKTLTAPAGPPKASGRAVERLPRGYRGKGELWDINDRYINWMSAAYPAGFTLKNHHAELQRFMRFLDGQGVTRIADVTQDVLEAYSLAIRQTKRGLAPRPHYVHHRLVILQQFFRWVTGQGLILLDPTEDLELPKLGKTLPRTILTQEEARRVLDAPDLRSPVGYRDKALLELLYASGIRSRELMRLTVSDIDVRNRTVFVRQGKGSKDRLVPVPALPLRFVMEYVEKVRPRFARNIKGEDDGTIFLNWTGAKLDINRLCDILRKNAKLAGLVKHVTAMTFRHSLISHLLENGMPLRHLQELAGHENLSTTENYAHVTLTGLRSAYAKAFPRERSRGRQAGA